MYVYKNKNTSAIDSFIYKFYEKRHMFVDFVGMLGTLSFKVGSI